MPNRKKKKPKKTSQDRDAASTSGDANVTNVCNETSQQIGDRRQINIVKGNTQVGDQNTMICGSVDSSPSDSSDETTLLGKDEATRPDPADWPQLPTNSRTDDSATPKSHSSAWKKGSPPGLTLNLMSNTTQIGDGNSVINTFVKAGGSPSQPNTGTPQHHLKAQDCKTDQVIHVFGSSKSHNIVTDKTYICSNINMGVPKCTNLSTYRAGQIKRFRENVNCFSEGYYMLIVDEPDHVSNIDALGLVKWLVVLDMDPQSRRTGLLSRIGKQVSKRLLLNPLSWQDTRCTITDKSITWIGMMGVSDRPDSIIDGDFKAWKKKIKSNLAQQLTQIKKFTEQYTKLTVVALWPSQYSKVKHVHYMITEISETLSARVLVVLEENANRSKEEESILTLLDDEDDISIVHLDLKDVCSVIQGDCISESVSTPTENQLPTSDGTNNPGITDRESFWLAEDLDVLYFQNATGIHYNKKTLMEEEQTFFRGGTLPWSWWYEVGPGVIDVERDIHRKIINFIKTRHLQQCKSGRITLYHNPGSGGTTVAQRVIWELRHEVPCLQIKHRSGSLVPDIFEKIKMLYDRTHMPIIVLVDGEDQQRIESIFRSLRDHVCIILLYVQRYWGRLTEDDDNNVDAFWLKSVVSKKESMLLERQYLQQCSNEDEKWNVSSLASDVQKKNKEHSMFEFGLAAHGYKYRGISKYVAGYLKLVKTEHLKPWQKALEYLSLVYFFGQSSIPCHFFTDMLQSQKAILTLEDFPQEMKELIVRDVHQRKNNMVRISHHLVAKEILNHMLPFPSEAETTESPNLSTNAKKRLGSISVEFIEFSGKQSDGSSNLSYIMTKTFISRNNKAVGENETQACRKRRPRISPILEQASFRAPFTERFDILKQLTKSFPSEAQFRAHLGRLYTICRPEEEKEAEMCLKEALEMSLADVEGMAMDDIPHSNKVDLMHIYHMFGNMILLKVSKYTGKYWGQRPKITTGAQDFETVALHILQLVRQACELFTNSREITPLGCEESIGYICDIQVRLMFCDFVHQNSDCKNVHRYMETRSTDAAEFVRESCVILDELFLECFSVIEPEQMDRNVDNCQEWYTALFKTIPGHVIPNASDDLNSRRFQVAKIKMKYAEPAVHCVLEHIDSSEDIHFIAEVYEKNIEEYESQDGTQDVSKRSMDIDYREWLYAIRHRLFKKTYPIEKVLLHVEIWYEKLHSPHSRFYMFVLKSLLGFGMGEDHGNTQLLIESQQLREDILKFSRLVTKPRYPREWLGRPQKSILRLAPGLRFFGQIEGRDIPNHDLEVRKGTICPPNDKPTGGYIDLDLGPRNRIPVKVFFIPARADDQLKGSINKGSRVEFVIGFSLLHGYEAFNVKRLRTENCPKCEIEVEKRSNDISVECPRCKQIIILKRKAHNKSRKGNGHHKKC